ncbi:MAG: TIGR03546 family protein [Bdellovibrionota bacterium]
MLTALAKLLKVLNSETDPGQISLALCFSMVAGFTPFFALHNLLVLLLVLVLRVNLSAFSLGTAAFSLLAFALDPLFHQVGLAALTAEGLRGLWTALYNQTLWRVERFNNSVVMGSLIVSIVLFVPAYFASNVLIKKYRENILQWVQKTRLMTWLKATKFYGIYEKVQGWRSS